jgi:RNA polymerase sigma factor (sigma-70 family)
VRACSVVFIILMGRGMRNLTAVPDTASATNDVVAIGAAERFATDDRLVARVRRGDDRAFEELYDRYRARIAAYIQGMVRDHQRAEDLSQEVFISALRRMRETDRPIAFKPWVYEIAKNACIDQYRRSRRAEEISFDADDALSGADRGRLADGGLGPEAAVDQKHEIERLCGAFGGLSDSHHEILVLRELEGLSYREIGERMGLSRPAVESTLFRARKRLTEEYEDLASGRRCQRIQSILAAAIEAPLGARDQSKLGRHLSYCQPCRKQARLLGVDTAVPARRPVRQRIAALLPIPAFLKRKVAGGDVASGSFVGASGPAVTAAAPVLDHASAAWGKAAAIVVVALAGAGATEMAAPGGTTGGTLPTAGLSAPAPQNGGGASTPAAVRTVPASFEGSGAMGAGGSGSNASPGSSSGSGSGSPAKEADRATGGAVDVIDNAAGEVPAKTGNGGLPKVQEVLRNATGGSGSSGSSDSGSSGSSGSTGVKTPSIDDTVKTIVPSAPPESAPVKTLDPATTVTDTVGGVADDVSGTVDDTVSGVTGQLP